MRWVSEWKNHLQEQLAELVAWPPWFGPMAERLLSSLAAEELLDLEDILGRMSYYERDEWEQLSPPEVRKLARGSFRTWSLGLLSFHRNGYVRHEAVRLLARQSDGNELRYLVIRQNDWVEPISRDARAAVEVRLTEHYLPEFVRILPLVVRLLAFTRYQHFPTVQKVVEMLCRPKHAALISEILGSAHRSSRRHVARIALDHPGEHRRRVIECGLASDDGVLRLWSCRAVPSTLGGDDLKSILDKLKNDRFMPVRRETLRIRAQHFPASARAIWEGGLLDSNAAIREVARYELNKLGSFDAAAFYRNTIANEPANIAGLCGLGEAGDVSDVAMLRSYLTSPTPGHRRAALRGIASLAEEAAVADILRCLDDVSPAVVREAQKNIAPLLYLVDAERLFQLSSGNRPWHVRRTACRLIFELGKWKSLPWLIRLSVHEDQRIAQLAQELAAAWFSFPRATRVFTTLLDAERQAILEAVDATRNRIPIGFLASIEDWLTRG